MNRPAFSTRHHGVAAAACFVLAVLVGTGLNPGYSHTQHPVALLAAEGMPAALALGILMFVVPGLLAAHVALALRTHVLRSGLARVGTWVLGLSSLAFAAQGLFPLDANELDGPRSQWHASAWMLWWLAFAAGALEVALGARRLPATAALVWSSAAAAVAVVLLAALLPAFWGAGLSQRLAFGAWLAWLVVAGRMAARPALRP